MALLTLPNEILGRIIKETMPEDFENFVVSSKAVYHATGNLLNKHNIMRRRYRHFKYSGNGDLSDPDTCASSPQLIARIAADPLIARYMISADLKEDPIPGEEENIEALIQQLENSWEVRSLFDDSPYLKEAGIDPSAALRSVIECCVAEDENTGLAAAFLLTLLLNVTEISLPKYWEQWDYNRKSPPRQGINEIWDMSAFLEVFVKRANDPYDSTAGLSKVTSLLPSTAWGYDNRWTLSTFTPFLSIKSLRRFCAGSCRAIDDGYTGAVFDIPECKDFGLGLELVELVGAVVDGNELLKFLQRLPQLKTFRLSYETKWHGCGHDFDALDAMTAIEEAVGDQLQELSFTILTCYGEIETRVTSMKEFTALKKLELDMAVLPKHDDYNDDQICSSHNSIPRLSDLLPSAIETLVLVADEFYDYGKQFARLFSDNATDLEEKIPNLKEVVIRYKRPRSNGNDSSGTADVSQVDPGWKTELMALEPLLEIEFVEVDDDSLPQFMERFCHRYEVEIL